MSLEPPDKRDQDRPVPTFRRQRLVLFLDGTWNNDDGSAPQTHIVRLRNLVDPYFLDAEGVPWFQRVYYDTGVGTGWSRLDGWLGGAFGLGLDDNVREAYRYISQFYAHNQPDCETTEICVFGFSRGAFTARSLVGYIAASGLLKAEYCTENMERIAWEYYRTPVEQRSPGLQTELRRYCHPHVRVSCLGVFDTVGALGIPSHYLNVINRLRYSFHDTEVSSIIDYGFHALAVDEQRQPFQATVWQKPRHEFFRRVEQVWFPGVHSDIGGGYENFKLSILPLQWMLERIRSRDLVRFNDADTAQWFEVDPEALAQAPQHNSRSRWYRIFFPKPLLRIINQTMPGPKEARNYELNPFKPFESPIGEMLHWSVLRRFGQSVQVEPPSPSAGERVYRPRNVDLILPRLAHTYRAGWDADTPDALRRMAEDWARTHPQQAKLAMLVVKPVTVDGVTQMRELDPTSSDDARLVVERLAAIIGHSAASRDPAPSA
jgi:hypothetical protein